MSSTSSPSGTSRTRSSEASGHRVTREQAKDGEPIGEGKGQLVDGGPRHDDRTPDKGLPSTDPTGGIDSAIPSCSLRCERCGSPEPIDRELCDGPCARWIGAECYIVYGSSDVYCLDCRPPPPAPTRPPPSVEGGISGFALTEGIAEESPRESAVMKERRIARDERNLKEPPRGKPPKGGGDG